MASTKRLCVALALAGVILSVPNVVKAANESQILSHGTLLIKNPDNDQYVEFYAEDIRYLQSELDKLFAEVPGNYRPTRTVTYSAPRKSNNVATDTITETETVVSE